MTSKGPSNVQHLGHIGVVNGVFSANNLPQEWKEAFKQAGVKKQYFNNPALRDLFIGIMVENGGQIDADDVAGIVAQQQQPQKTQPTPPVREQPSLPQKPPLPTPTLNNNNNNNKPSPQLPPQRPMPQTTPQPTPQPIPVSDDAPMMRGTPPPMKSTATNSVEQPTGRAPRAPRGPATNLGGTHKPATDSEKPTSTAPPKRENPLPTGNGDLMAEIARGKALRNTAQTERPAPEIPIENKPQGLAGALSAALEANRLVLGGGLDDEDEGSDWD